MILFVDDNSGILFIKRTIIEVIVSTFTEIIKRVSKMTTTIVRKS